MTVATTGSAAATTARLSATEAAAYLALVQAQAASRRHLTQAAVDAVFKLITGFDGWWDTDRITALTRQIVKQVQPAQVRAARLTDAYVARVVSKQRGRTVRPVGAIDVTELRRKLPENVIEDLAHDRRDVPWVEIGDTDDGPGDGIDAELDSLLTDDDERLFHAAEDAYGRLADRYRWDVIARGASHEEALAKVLDRAKEVVDTDIALAIRDQEHHTARRLGVKLFRRVLHPELAESGLSCGLCIVAADRVYKVDRFKRELHAQCVPAGTRVAAEGVLAVTRRAYTGQLVVLSTASGQEMTITPNHPVLTSKGWVPAGLVREGDDVVRHHLGHGVAGRGPEEGDGPPLIEEVWRAASVGSTLDLRAVPLSAENFHGDGADGEVDVVAPHRDLPRMGDVSFAHPGGEPSLVCRHGLRPLLTGESLFDQFVLSGGLAADCGVGSGDDASALIDRSPVVAEEIRRGAAASLNPGVGEDAGDDVAADAVGLSEHQLGRTGVVRGDDLGVGQVVPAPTTRFDPPGLYDSEESRLAYAQLGSDLLDRLAGDVSLDRVVQQRWIEGTHEVFNLHTVEGWYSANNCIVSNCHCTMIPIEADSDPGLQLNSDDLESLYRAAGTAVGTSRETGGAARNKGALRRVRVGITEHGELGPILVKIGTTSEGKLMTERVEEARVGRQRRTGGRDEPVGFRTVKDYAKTQTKDPKIRARAQLDSLERSLATLEAKAAEGIERETRTVGEREVEVDIAGALKWQREQVARLRRIAGE